MNELKGKVAQILNARELVVNIGSVNGVKPGMKFAVLSEQPLNIRDPENGEEIGVVDREKIRVEVTEVQNRISICKTYRTIREPAKGRDPQTAMQELLAVRIPVMSWITPEPYTPPKEYPETLRADDSSLPPPLSPSESFVKINDRVIQVS